MFNQVTENSRYGFTLWGINIATCFDWGERVGSGGSCDKSMDYLVFLSAGISHTTLFSTFTPATSITWFIFSLCKDTHVQTHSQWMHRCNVRSSLQGSGGDRDSWNWNKDVLVHEEPLPHVCKPLRSISDLTYVVPPPSFSSVLLPAISRHSSTALMRPMSVPVNPILMASRPLRTCWPTSCCECPSGSLPSSLALVISWSSAWGHWSELRTTSTLPASKSCAVSETPRLFICMWIKEVEESWKD